MSDRYERRDFRPRAIEIFGLGLVISLILVSLAMGGLFAVLARRTAVRDAEPPPVRQPVQVLPAPRLQVNPILELDQWRAWEEQELNRYGWIDRDKGIARIPIERAMEVLRRRGLPARPSPEENR
ncbi:MAG: hypothetical protein HY716_14060 [Planctomycetes bacterium]|nr:hypothetical protein [Planctomycetota bacterium]